jgi:NitT/TauT family transport system permease protein
LTGCAQVLCCNTVTGASTAQAAVLLVDARRGVVGAGRLASAWHILLPAALPGYLTGLKQGWAFPGGR